MTSPRQEEPPEAGGLEAERANAPALVRRPGGLEAERESVPALVRRPATLLPRPGATLTVLQRYPDGVVALLDESGHRVFFLRLQEAFDLAWRPALESDRSEIS